MKKLFAKLFAWLFGAKEETVIKPIPVPDKQPEPAPIEVIPEPVIFPTEPPIIVEPIPVPDPVAEVEPKPVVPEPIPEVVPETESEVIPDPVVIIEPEKPIEVIPPVIEPIKPHPVIEVKPVIPVVTAPVVEPVKPTPLPPAAKTLHDSPIMWGVAFKESDLKNQTMINETYKHFKSLTPENGIKHGKLQKKKGEFNFTDPKQLIKIAKAKGLRVHAHVCFSWPTQQKKLPAFWHEAAKNKADYIALYKNTVQTIVKEFKNDIVGFDIVNEAHENDGTLRPCYELTHMGENYIEQIAKWVLEVHPSAKCFISDYGFETLSHKATVVIKYAGELKKRGLIHGISSQMHTVLGLNYNDYKNRLDQMAKQNLLVHLSEIDIMYCKPTDEVRKAKVFKDIAKGFRTLPEPLQYGCTVWSHTNERNFYNYQLKPAIWAPVIFDNNFNGGLTLPAILEVK